MPDNTPKKLTVADFEEATRKYRERTSPKPPLTVADFENATKKYKVRGALRDMMQDDDFLLDDRAEGLMDALWARGLIDASDSKKFTAKKAEAQKRKAEGPYKGFLNNPSYASPARTEKSESMVGMARGAAKGFSDMARADSSVRVGKGQRASGYMNDPLYGVEDNPATEGGWVYDKAKEILGNGGKPLTGSEVFGRSAYDAIFPGVAGLTAGGGLEAAASMLPIPNPLVRGAVRFGAGLLGNVVGAKGGDLAQNALRDAALGSDVAESGRQVLAQGAQAYPVAAAAGRALGQGVGQKPLNILKAPAALLKGEGKAVAKSIAKQQVATAASGAAISATLGHLERKGKTSPEEFLIDVASGAFLSGDMTKIGKRVHGAGWGLAEGVNPRAVKRTAATESAVDTIRSATKRDVLPAAERNALNIPMRGAGRRAEAARKASLTAANTPPTPIRRDRNNEPIIEEPLPAVPDQTTDPAIGYPGVRRVDDYSYVPERGVAADFLADPTGVNTPYGPHPTILNNLISQTTVDRNAPVPIMAGPRGGNVVPVPTERGATDGVPWDWTTGLNAVNGPTLPPPITSDGNAARTQDLSPLPVRGKPGSVPTPVLGRAENQVQDTAPTPPAPTAESQVPDIPPIPTATATPDATATEPAPAVPAPAVPAPATITNDAGDRTWVVTNKDSLRTALRDAFGMPEEQAGANAELFDRYATNWAERGPNRSKDQFYAERLAAVSKPGADFIKSMARADGARGGNRRAAYDRATKIVLALNAPRGIDATHELGHIFLEGFSPAEQDAFLGSIGSARTDTGAIPVEAHERFVASFLEWMRTGEAANGADAASAPLFQQFKTFLRDVYDRVIKWAYSGKSGQVSGKAEAFNPEVVKTLQEYLKANDNTTVPPTGDARRSDLGTGSTVPGNPLGDIGGATPGAAPAGIGDGVGGGKAAPAPEGIAEVGTRPAGSSRSRVTPDTSRPVSEIAAEVLKNSGRDPNAPIIGTAPKEAGTTLQSLTEWAIQKGRDRVHRSVGEKEGENDPDRPNDYQDSSQYEVVGYKPGDKTVYVSPKLPLNSSRPQVGLQYRRTGPGTPWTEPRVTWRDSPTQPGVRLPVYEVNLDTGHSSSPDEFFQLYANHGDEVRYVKPDAPPDTRTTDSAPLQENSNGPMRYTVKTDGINTLLRKNGIRVGDYRNQGTEGQKGVASKHAHVARELIHNAHGPDAVPPTPYDLLYSQEPTWEHTVEITNPSTGRKHKVNLRLTVPERDALNAATARREAAGKAIENALAAKKALPDTATPEDRAAASKAVSKARAQFRSASAAESVATANAIAASKTRARRNSGEALKSVNDKRRQAKMDAEDAERKAKGLPPLVRPAPGKARKVEIDPNATPRKIPPTVIDYSEMPRHVTRTVPATSLTAPIKTTFKPRTVEATSLDKPIRTVASARTVPATDLSKPIATKGRARSVPATDLSKPIKVNAKARTVGATDLSKPIVTKANARTVPATSLTAPIKTVATPRKVYATDITKPPKEVVRQRTTSTGGNTSQSAANAQGDREYQAVMDFAPDGWTAAEKEALAKEAKAAAASLPRKIGRALFGGAKYAGDVTTQSTASTDASGFRQISIIANPYWNARGLVKAAVAATKAATPDLQPWGIGKGFKVKPLRGAEGLRFGSRNMQAEMDAIKNDPLYKDFEEQIGYKIHEEGDPNTPGNEEMPGTTFVKHFPLMAMAERHFNTVKEVALFSYLKSNYNAMKAAQKHSPGRFTDAEIWREMRGFMDIGEVTMGRGDMAVTVPHFNSFMNRSVDTMLPGRKASRINAKIAQRIKADITKRAAFKIAVRAGLKLGSADPHTPLAPHGAPPTPSVSALDGMTIRDMYRFYSFEQSLKHMIAREKAAQAEADATNAAAPASGPKATPKYKGHDVISLASALNKASNHDLARVELSDSARGAIGLLLRAPSWTASRWQMHNPYWVNSLPEHARTEYLKARVAHAGWVLTQIGVYATMAYAAGRLVDTNETFDPDSRNFMGLNVDDVHYNFGAAATQDIRLMAKVLKHLINTPQEDQVKSQGEMYANKARRVRDDITGYARAKLSPLAGLPITFALRKNVVGEDAFRQHEGLKAAAGWEANAELVGAVSPMIANNILEAFAQGQKRRDAGEYPMGGWGYVLSTAHADFTGAAQAGVYPTLDSHGNPKRLKSRADAAARPPREKPASKFDITPPPPAGIMDYFKGRASQ